MKVRVKIALAIAADGTWRAVGQGFGSRLADEDGDMNFAHELYGEDNEPVGEPHAEYWIEAEVETPVAATVQGVAKASSEAA